jgi:hypothetical protein
MKERFIQTLDCFPALTGLLFQTDPLAAGTAQFRPHPEAAPLNPPLFFAYKEIILSK